ncbi:hypothetical protein PCANC_12136 [Puccinia coronata f. sp. avenae]|uniref:Uncharacterized protein n=1 Tax=Puccinia coronata f. sp. avenae TaxID=200324 RepID=A0A2N5VGG2_9BASI|nr:hypothetical protein PCANC_12136 [Puccinia coronata f. sp. avenae]
MKLPGSGSAHCYARLNYNAAVDERRASRSVGYAEVSPGGNLRPEAKGPVSNTDAPGFLRIIRMSTTAAMQTTQFLSMCFEKEPGWELAHPEKLLKLAMIWARLVNFSDNWCWSELRPPSCASFDRPSRSSHEELLLGSVLSKLRQIQALKF